MSFLSNTTLAKGDRKKIYLGVIFLLLFAIAWLIYPLFYFPFAYQLTAVLLLVIEILLLVWAVLKWQSLSGPSLRNERNMNLWFNIIFSAEFVSILVAANMCRVLGQPDAVSSAIAIVVGLHFIPLAKVLKMPLYYPLAGLLIVAGGICIAVIMANPGSLTAKVAIDYAASLIFLAIAAIYMIKLRD